jgi:hypothetical protein
VTSPAASQRPVTFSKDIAPIFQKACGDCHRPDSIAPMSLMTYDAARPWARSIKQRVQSREMPPWFIDRRIGIQHFKEDPSLGDDEIALIAKWVDSGAPQGDPKDMPAPLPAVDIRSGTSERLTSSCGARLRCRRPVRTSGGTCSLTPV